jgi:hypothetical protein
MGQGFVMGRLGTGTKLGEQSFTYTGKGETSVLPCWAIVLPHFVSKVFPIPKCSSYLIIQLNLFQLLRARSATDSEPLRRKGDKMLIFNNALSPKL